MEGSEFEGFLTGSLRPGKSVERFELHVNFMQVH
jgi:hypothetical protein